MSNPTIPKPVVLWYSFARLASTAYDSELVSLSASIATCDLTELVRKPFVFFFEPTPYPQVSDFDPIVMAERISAVQQAPTVRTTAFISPGSPIPFETQAAFAVQVASILGLQAGVRLVVPKMPSPVGGSPKRGQPTERRSSSQSAWSSALTAALNDGTVDDHVPETTQALVANYLRSRRQGSRFSPTQRRLLHRTSTGEVGVIAEDVAEDLHVTLVTAQRAIRGIVTELFGVDSGRRSPELIGQLVAKYGWFLRYNKVL